MYEGNIFFPYGWVDESFDLPQSDADDIKDSLYLVNNVAHMLQFWSLIASGILFTIILAMLYRGHLDMLARGQTLWHAYDQSPSDVYKQQRGAVAEDGAKDLRNPISEERLGDAYLRHGASPLIE
jgi:hypothetical protein